MINQVDISRTASGFENVASLGAVIKDFGQVVNLCLELKPQLEKEASLLLKESVLSVLQKARGDGLLTRRIIIDSFDRNLSWYAKDDCQCEIAWDTPFKQKITKEILQTASLIGFDWIYVHHSMVSSNLLNEVSKRGIKVMVYTVNDTPELRGLIPDGIITDEARLIADYQ